MVAGPTTEGGTRHDDEPNEDGANNGHLSRGCSHLQSAGHCCNVGLFLASWAIGELAGWTGTELA
jgi:hypothetical protein